MNSDDRSKKSGKPSAPGKIDPAVQSHIGSKLRDMYDGVLHEPIPDRFVELLKQLEDRDDK